MFRNTSPEPVMKIEVAAMILAVMALLVLILVVPFIIADTYHKKGLCEGMGGEMFDTICIQSDYVVIDIEGKSSTSNQLEKGVGA